MVPTWWYLECLGAWLDVGPHSSVDGAVQIPWVLLHPTGHVHVGMMHRCMCTCIVTSASTPQLPFKKPQIPSNRDHKNLNRGTLGGAGVCHVSYVLCYVQFVSIHVHVDVCVLVFVYVYVCICIPVYARVLGGPCKKKPDTPKQAGVGCE